MSDAKLERTQFKIKSSNYNEIFVANGEVLLFEGFLKVYLEGTDDDLEEDQGILPQISKDERLDLKELRSVQRFSRPPARFSEAALVKRLEELGIGRPSTYAPTISTVQNRGYVAKGVIEGAERNYHQLSLNKDEVFGKLFLKKLDLTKENLYPQILVRLLMTFW